MAPRTPEVEAAPEISETPEPEAPKMIHVSQSLCSALIYLGDAVVVQCGKHEGHATMPGYSVQHSITLQWKEDVARVSSDGS
jgi:hypothetical protein